MNDKVAIGAWLLVERSSHINELELLAALRDLVVDLIKWCEKLRIFILANLLVPSDWKLDSDVFRKIIGCIGYLFPPFCMVPSGPKALFIVGLRLARKDAGASTIARWLKSTLKKAGVGVSVFAAHSRRGSSASKAFQVGVPTERILAAASWQRESTFNSFHKRRIGRGD